MELRLERFINRLMDLADIRNLSPNNPIKVSLENPNTGTTTIIIIAFQEPFNYPLPVNVTWIVADPNDPFYKKAVRRIAKAGFTPPRFRHSWELLDKYDDLFEPPQYYDEEDRPLQLVSLTEFLHHAENKNNPHEVKAEQTSALPIKGGTMEGPIVLSEFSENNHVINKNYVDNLVNPVMSIVQGFDERILTTENKMTDLEKALFDMNNKLNLINSNLNVRGFAHIQSSLNSIWEITHNLDSWHINLNIMDWNGDMVIPDSISMMDENKVEINFIIPMIGRANLIAIK